MFFTYTVFSCWFRFFVRPGDLALLAMVCGAVPLGASVAQAAQPAQSANAGDPRKLATLGLTPGQEQIFNEVAADEFCGCDSALSLQGCLTKRPTCSLADDAGRILAKAIKSGVPKRAVSGFMSQGVLGPFCSLPRTIDIDKAPWLGAKKPTTTIVEFADFRCTHCKQAVPSVHRALKTYGDTVKLVYMPVALVENSPSSVAAEAALAADAQNKFWPMHEALFSFAGEFDEASVRKIAEKVGLNLKRFDLDMKEHRHLPRLKLFMQRFLALNLEGTPAFFVGGRRFDLEMSVFSLEDRLLMEQHRHAGDCH